VQDEINPALAAKQGFDVAAQQVFAAGALRKFQERLIVDPLERQVRDPIRKLGRHDRLVGAAELVLEFGGEPRHLALAIAAALRYRNPNDPSAERLQQMIADDGLDEVLRRICGIDPTGPLAGLIRESDEELDRVIST
jgi:mannitol-1-phosphate 5-dehydrogenase